VRLPGGGTSERLAERLHALDYTVEGVRLLLGVSAADALDREEVVPARRVLKQDGSPLAVATSFFLLGDACDETTLRAVLDLDTGELGDLVDRAGGQARAVLELAPYGADARDWLVASDWSTRHTARPAHSEHVLGVGGASTMLAQCTVRPEVDRALDLGTGCGVQALHLSGHAGEVIGTDVSGRCLEVARFNMALNRVRVDLRQGSLFDPVAAESFDLVVSNPPFVIGSPAAGRHTYRDSGLPGDAVCAGVLKGAAAHLSEGGWCQLLANWEITEGDDWSAHPRQWLDGLDAWVIQRDVQDPAAYVETWLRDAGEHLGAPGATGQYARLYDEWLTALQRRGVLGIGFGLISARRGGHSAPVHRFQHAPQSWVQPVAPDIERWFAVHDLLQADASALLRLPLSVAADVVVEQRHRPDQHRTEPVTMLRRDSGMAWMAPIDDFGLAVLERLAGDRPAGEVVAGVSAEWGVDAETALGGAVGVLSQLAEEGFVRW
jgi:methylase of polypeptide subunit release factors